MKKYILLILPLFLYASSFNELIKSVDKNLLVKSKQQQTQALKSLVEAKKAKNLPYLNLHVEAIRLQDTPSTVFNIGGVSYPSVIGTRTNLDAELSIAYPLFTGFAITKSIEKAKLQVIKNRLKTKELKRKLYLNISSLYANIYALNGALQASKEAKTAIEDSYKKAKGLYDNGFIDISNLYKIEAKKYDIVATIKTYEEQKQNNINTLAYISDIKTDAKTLPKIELSTDEKNLTTIALNQREDIQELKTQLEIDDKDIALAKSRKYPQIALFGAIKKQGDNLALNGNGFTNADQSYVGASLKWNIFDADEIKNQTQAASYKKIAQKLYFNDYKRVVKKDIKNTFLGLGSLRYREKALSKQLEASKSYYKLTFGRFENNMADADELSRAIADLAKVKATMQSIKAKIFLQICKIKLQGGNNYFLQSIR